MVRYMIMLAVWASLVGPQTVKHSSWKEKHQINWLAFDQLEESLSKNENKEKLILISFHTDWCTYCRKMDREIYPDPEISTLVNDHFIAVKFDAETRDTIAFDGQLFTNPNPPRRNGPHTLTMLLASRNGRYSVPVTMILDAEFNVLARSFDYMGKKKMQAFLRESLKHKRP